MLLIKKKHPCFCGVVEHHAAVGKSEGPAGNDIRERQQAEFRGSLNESKH